MYPRTDPKDDTIKCKYYKEGENDPHHHIPFCPMPPKIYPNILETLGRTPMVRLTNVAEKEGLKCELLGKCEFLNAGGSLKDRIGYRMVLEAERTGRIKKGDTLIEATSGNTGIGMALAAAVKGYNMIITLPEKMSTEKTDVLKALGAKVVRTPTEANYDDDDSHLAIAIKMKNEIANSHILDQYINEGNPLAHYDGTGEEIVYQTDAKADYVFIGAGTGGTVTGIGRKIREKMPNCKIIAVDPHGSILAQPQSLNTRNESYLMEGIGYDFVPRVIDRKVVDDWVKIDDHDALPMARRLIREEGLFCGGSSGGVVQAAINYAKEHKLGEGVRIVCVLPDNLRNYITKLVSKEWMVEKNLYDVEQLREPDHRFNGVPISKLGDLQKVTPITESATIGEALALLNNNSPAVPIVKDGAVTAVIWQDKLMEAIVNKSLTKNDSVKKAWNRDITALPYEKVDVAIVERILERRRVVFLFKEKCSEIFAVTHSDILKLLI